MIFNTQLIKLFKRLESSENLDKHEVSTIISELVSLGQSSFKHGIKNLNNPDIKEYCIRLIKEFINEKNINEVMELLNNHDSKIRESAYRIIADRDNKLVYPRLLDMYQNDLIDRHLIASLLIEKYEKSFIAELIKLLDSERSEVRRGALNIIEKIGQNDFNQEILKRLKDNDWWLRANAMRILSNRDVYIDISILKDLLNDIPEVVKVTLNSIQKIKDTRVIDHLISLLFNEDITVQKMTIDALGAIGNKEVIEKLVEIFSSNNQYAKRGAIEVLNVIGGTETKETLLKMLKDEDWWIRSRAADTLCEIGGDEVEDIGNAFLKEKDKELRRIGIEILNNLKKESSLEHLLDVIFDEDWWVRTRASDAISNLKAEIVVPQFLNIMEKDSNRKLKVIQVLKNYDLPEVKVALTNCLADPDTNIKRSVLKALIDLDVKEALPQIENMLDDDNMRVDAEDAIERLSNKNYRPKYKGKELSSTDLIRVLGNLKFSKEHGLRGSLKDLSLPVLIQMMEMEKKNALLILESPGDITSKIYFKDGRIIDAQHDILIGEEAFYSILRLKEGNFRFEELDTLHEERIDKPTQSILMDGLRMIDEENK
jgi:HEAT repeat protein